MSHKLVNGMEMWKGKGNTILLFSLKELEILHQERRGQVKTMVMEHFNGICFLEPGSANKQHTKQTINQDIGTLVYDIFIFIIIICTVTRV